MSNRLVSRIASWAQAWRHYGNPAGLLWQRLRADALDEFHVVDRLSGIAFDCKPGAHRMFGEVWFDRDYDVPGLELRPGDVVLDVGGNQGFFACYAAWRKCRVLSFEPDSENLEFLRRNLQRNGLAGAATVFGKAVKAAAGPAKLFRTSRLGGGMNTTSSVFAERLGFAEGDTMAIEATTLPQILREQEIERVRLCKLDCEGAELEIVESLGAAEMAKIDAFAIEFHREAYPPEHLAAALLRWGTHQVFPAAAKPHCRREIIYALSLPALRESFGAASAVQA